MIAAGRIGDLVVVDGDLASDIKCLTRVRAVYQAGRKVYADEANARDEMK